MPRPKKPGAPEPKRRSRNGCWPCKARKVKCGEERPRCLNCQRSGEACDYSIRLNWEGRRSKKGGDGFGVIQFDQASSQSDKSTPSSKLATSPSTSGFKAVNFEPPSTVKRPAAKSSQAWSSEIASGPLYVPVSAATAFPTTQYDFQTQISFAPNNDNTHSSGTLHPSHDAGLESMDMPGPPSKRLKYSLGGSEGDDPSFQSMAAPYHPRSSETHVAPDHLAPSAFHDDFHQMHAHPTPEAFRRLSVNSLLSGDSVPSQEERLREATGSYLGLDSKVNRLQQSTYYGIDRGFTDLDVGVNDDLNAITGASPKLSRREIVGEEDAEEEHPTEFGFGAYSNEVDGFAGGYYDRPVIVRIPQTFEPLPDKLRDNPMNLLYFHHFLNHTSRVLVPHDDPGSNPFRTVLPLMAVTNDHLLSLLLAYSASHRARLLQQPEPATRIALWVQDIFPALRHALDNPDTEISSTDVATAIMLASLEIICPSAFEVHIPWQKHLTLARELVTARPALLKVNHHSSREAQAQGHQVCAFLWSWFAYLDVLGSLSGGGQDASPVWVLEYRVYHPDDDDEIDCIMGFTTCCIYILARIAELAKKSDAERLRAQSRRVTGQGAIRDDGAQNETDAIEDNALSTWQPSAEAQAKAQKLEADVRESLAQPPRPCQHIHNLNTWDRREMIATNEAYHWAALIHLWRRVWGAPTEDARVQEAVGKIFDCLRKVRRCGSAEGCLLFPMFTAGCETRDAENREYILERMKTVEKTGMTQVSRARRLMERVWEVGQPWETLLSTEFIG